MFSPSVTVITPTTCRPSVIQAIQSVKNQTYDKVTHFIVFDGPEQFSDKIYDHIRPKDFALVLPENTGANNFNGHRIYAAVSYLINTDYVAFLDEDNWYEPNHIESLVTAVQPNSHRDGWAWARRNIVDELGNFICKDECESLGSDRNVFCTETKSDYLVDVSCFFMNIRQAISVSPFWYRKARAENTMPADRSITRFLLEHCPFRQWSGEYSVNYRVGSRYDSVQSEFFIQGNAKMKEKKS